MKTKVSGALALQLLLVFVIAACGNDSESHRESSEVQSSEASVKNEPGDDERDFAPRYEEDALKLTKFLHAVQLASQDNRKAIRILNPKGGKGQFSDLVLEMWNAKLVSADEVALLAGTTGRAASSADLASGQLDANESVVFTGPNTGEALLKLLKGKQGDGVMFCYNRHFIRDNLPEKMVLVFAGESSATVMTSFEIQHTYNAANTRPVLLEPDFINAGSGFYGKPPFQNVVPE